MGSVMFENQSQPLMTRLQFVLRFLRSAAIGSAIIFGSLFLGMLGYRQFEGMNWTDAFLNASMLLSGMGPISAPATENGKLFAGMYALYSGFVVILASGIVFAPLVHRMLHRFHIPKHHARTETMAGTHPHVANVPEVTEQSLT